MVRGVAFAALTALLLAGCSSSQLASNIKLPPEKPKQAEMTPAAQREHNRILAAYGGAYEDAALEKLTGGIVDKLVAASDRPDLAYRVTILNSPAINAFALPGG